MRCQSGCFTDIHSGCPERQKTNFSPNWMSRGLVPGSVLLTTPKFKFDGEKLVFGGANCVRLKILKNSLRNSSPSLSSGPKRVLLNSAKSKFLIPDPRSVESARDSLPKVKSAGCVKQAVLNHSFSCPRPLKGDALLHPATTFGRECAPKSVT